MRLNEGSPEITSTVPLKHMLVGILNLKNGMEDNLHLLNQEINVKKGKREKTEEEEKKEKEMEGEEEMEGEGEKVEEEWKGLNEVVLAAQQHIDSISSMFTLGVSCLKEETDNSTNIIQGFIYLFSFVVFKNKLFLITLIKYSCFPDHVN